VAVPQKKKGGFGGLSPFFMSVLLSIFGDYRMLMSCYLLLGILFLKEYYQFILGQLAVSILGQNFCMLW
jgi:hypothetical protein